MSGYGGGDGGGDGGGGPDIAERCAGVGVRKRVKSQMR